MLKHLIVIVLYCVLAAGPVQASAPGDGLPNVVFILIDDMGLGDSRVYNPESKIPTPAMDELARTGIVFTDAHSTSALCAPTRYSVLTGNYPFRGRKDLGVWPAFDEPMTLPGQQTIGDIMKQAGYHTAMLGKLNNGGLFHSRSDGDYTNQAADIDFSRSFDRGPIQLGFDYSFNLLVGIQSPPYAYFENDKLVGNPADLVHREATSNGSSRTTGLAMSDYDSREAGPILCNKALDFIDRHCREQSNRPFFMYYATQAAHVPFTPPEHLNGIPVKGVSGISDHCDMIYEADVVIGQLMRKLEQEGVLDNTLFIVTSDNGGLIRQEDQDNGHLNAQGVINGIPLRGYKTKIYEGGHRVPFIARWGDGTAAGSKIPPGTVSDEMICLQDLAATLLAVTGQNMPSIQYRDSYNALPALLGEQADAPVRDLLFSQSGWINRLDNRLEFLRSIRLGPWKLIVSSEARDTDEALTRYASVLELYNLEQDIAEQHNLAAQSAYRQRIKDMADQLFTLMHQDRTSPEF
jgi:arylsulfatase A-like enzyme